METNNISYICSLCNQSFSRKRNLDYHISNNVCTNIQNSISNKNQISYRTCFICNPPTIFASRRSLRVHLYSIHTISIGEYDDFLKNIQEWSAEIHDNWGKISCFYSKWLDRDWLIEYWNIYTIPKNHLPLFSIFIPTINENNQEETINEINNEETINEINNEETINENEENEEKDININELTENDLHNILSPKPIINKQILDIQSSIFDFLSNEFSHIQSSYFDHFYTISSFYTEKVNKEESKWLTFFFSLPPSPFFWDFFFEHYLLFYKQLKSSYLQKKWLFPILYFTLWIRWCFAFIHTDNYPIEAFMNSYCIYFDSRTNIPYNESKINENVQRNIEKINKNFSLSFD
jgi:hypothetical protein